MDIEKEIGNYRIVASMYVRVGGSKPYRCFWKLCGKTLLQRGIEIVKNSKYVNDVVIATEDSRIKEAAEKYGAKVAVRPYFQTGKFPLDLAGPPFNRQKPRSLIHMSENVYLGEDSFTKAYISEVFGIIPDLRIFYSIQTPLFKTESVDRLIEKFFEDEEAWVVYAAYVIDSKIVIINHKINRLLPIFYDPIQGLDRQDLPSVYRAIGCAVHGCARYVSSEDERKRGYIIVEREEGINIHTEEDLALAEFYMKRRLESGS